MAAAAIYASVILLALLLVFTSILCIVVIANIASLLITRVPPISTDRKYLAKILQQAVITPQSVVYDLGCGSGNFLMAAAKLGPKKCVGYELSLMPYLAAALRSIFGPGNARVHFRDFFKADISDADIVYIYLVPPLLERVARKLKAEMKPGAVALSKGVPLPGLEFSSKIILDAERSYPLYSYKF